MTYIYFLVKISLSREAVSDRQKINFDRFILIPNYNKYCFVTSIISISTVMKTHSHKQENERVLHVPQFENIQDYSSPSRPISRNTPQTTSSPVSLEVSISNFHFKTKSTQVGNGYTWLHLDIFYTVQPITSVLYFMTKMINWDDLFSEIVAFIKFKYILNNLYRLYRLGAFQRLLNSSFEQKNQVQYTNTIFWNIPNHRIILKLNHDLSTARLVTEFDMLLTPFQNSDSFS